ncbi:MAG: DEAD/DEAH box helicase family protein [Thermaceae bacterium]|nr:DEAD/DEAH box helicase family protein [Thermaceae bacterium]
MHREVNEIANRLSLRKPQRDSLEALHGVLNLIGFENFVAAKGSRRVADSLGVIRAAFPTVQDFEREFVSLCFALATGVGKTRLMGAFIAYLHKVYGVNNFFVLAPNLTIYNKLMGDFTPGKPKYVFKGMGEFVQYPPMLINGENYAQTDWASPGLFGRIRINIFNISKINSEVRGGKEPRIKRFQEVLGDGYFQYLSTLPDLVLLMDESHRYRASAGVRAINELRPALGLELTATPFVETARGATAFQNVLVDYPLGRAIADGFVKEPAVVTRRNFNPSLLNADEIERMKLEDGIYLHQTVKAELQTYAQNTEQPMVKPFVLVIARDTTHASALRECIASTEFFEGRYADKVIQVDSSQSEELMIERLLKVEDPAEPTEIVIHVNMLKEGWDVTNLYTIIPLRAASARILIEQSIGRGLRLPYGKRTGVTAVDRLNIVAHDKFQEIVDEANRPDSLIRLQTVILEDENTPDSLRTVQAQPDITALLGITQPVAQPAEDGNQTAPTAPIFMGDLEQRIARETYRVMQSIGKQSGDKAVTTQQLLEPETQKRIVEEVQRRIAPAQTPLEFPQAPSSSEASTVAAVVAKTAEIMVARTISIPRIMTLPVGEVKRGFTPFVLSLAGLENHWAKPTAELLSQSLSSNEQTIIGFQLAGIPEKRLEDHLVFSLMDEPEVDYFTQADLLYDLASQMVRHFSDSLGKSEKEIEQIFQVYRSKLAAFIYVQMQRHRYQEPTEYETRVSHGFVELRPSAYTAPTSSTILNVHVPPPGGADIGRYVYGHFRRCLYPITKFQSNQERILAGILEQGSEKWFRPARGQLQMEYRIGQEPQEYQPDFVAELADRIVMLEVKAADERDSPEVLEKARVARQWCEHASRHAQAHGGKPWSYHLLTHDRIQSNMSLSALLIE